MIWLVCMTQQCITETHRQSRVGTCRQCVEVFPLRTPTHCLVHIPTIQTAVIIIVKGCMRAWVVCACMYMNKLKLCRGIWHFLPLDSGVENGHSHMHWGRLGECVSTYWTGNSEVTCIYMAQIEYVTLENSLWLAYHSSLDIEVDIYLPSDLLSIIVSHTLLHMSCVVTQSV